MADGLCVEGMATNDNGTSLNETIDLLGIPRTDSLNTEGLETMKPAFYINGESGELCSNFRVNGVVTLGVHASRDMLCSANTDDMDFTSLCPDTIDNCRKKRCADRYDSSESSDSGVAVLSCTDCSASSSSATSDITEPGSPFSTASSHSSHSDGGVEGGSGGSGVGGGVAAEQAARWPPGSPSAADPSATPAPSPAVPACPAAPHCAGAPTAAVVVLQPYFMAPNVPSDQRDDSLHCWAWAGVGVGGGGGKDGSAVELERDRGPPPLPPPLQQPPPPPSSAPLSPVTANNVLASINSKALKRQTAIVSHKTAPITSSPGNKRLKLDHSPSSKPGLANNNNNNASGKNGTSLCAALRHQPQRCCAAVLHPKTASAKGVKADAKARAIGSALAQGDASAHAKLHQQGKITEYFKTQMKPMSGMKKDLTAKTAAVVGAAGLPGNRKSVADVKTDKNSAGGLEKYFNVNSGTQSSAVPLSKVAEVKDLIGANLPASAPVQSLSWNSKCNTVCSNRSSKAAQKANEKKNVVALSSLSAKELSSPATTLKIPDMKKNGFVSPSLASQKMNVLLLPPPSMQNDSSPSTYSPNLPESSSCVTDVTQKASDVVYDVPKPNSASDDQLLASEVMVTSTPVGKITPISEDSAMSTSTSGDQTESIASVSSDSGLSISVSSSSPAPSSLPSPILSVPRTIRFPAVNCNRSTSSKGASGESSEATTCRWTECNAHFDSSSSLLEHLQAKHVNTQGMCETFVCLWVGCKVYARTSCSRSWLERHVLSHGGNKPFPCIVDGCGQRFSSQTTLERHVNSHFNQSEAGGSGSGARRSVDSSSSKLFRRNGKRLRLRRQPWSARMFDYFDSGIMEGLQHRLMSMTEKRTLGDVATAPGNTITLHSKVMGHRTESSGLTKVLLKWYPEDILDDEWVLESNIRRTQSVPISQLPPSSVDPLYTTLFSNANCSGSKNCASTIAVDDSSAGCSINCVASPNTSRRKPRKQGKPIS